MELPITKTAFWDVDLEKMNQHEHADFIIARVFQYGLLEDMKIVVRYYSGNQIKHAIEHTRGIMDKNSLALASLFVK